VTAQARAALRAVRREQQRVAALTRHVQPLGTTGVDGEFAVFVKSIRTVASVPQEGDVPARPIVGDRFVLVDIRATNRGTRKLPPFAAQGFGILLVDGRGRRYEILDDNFVLPGAFVSDVRPGATASGP